MMKKLWALIYLFVLAGGLFSSFFIGHISSVQADDCMIALQGEISGANINFGYEINLYTLKPTDKVILISSGPQLGQNKQETDITGGTFTQPKPTTDYNYQVQVIDSITNASRCMSVPAIYDHATDTVIGGEDLGAGRVEETPINPAGEGIWSDFGKARNVGDYVSLVLRWAIPVLGFLAFLMMIYAGYMYMTSQGNPETINKAKEIIIGVIVGIVLLFTIEILLKNVIGTL